MEISGTPSIEDWLTAMRTLGQADASLHWWIGDGINYADGAYGEKYEAALEQLPFAYQTLRHDAYVANEFELFRRRNNLSWTHHAVVAGLSHERQDALFDQFAGVGKISVGRHAAGDAAGERH